MTDIAPNPASPEASEPLAITAADQSILRHASDNGRYVSDMTAALRALCDRRLLGDYGPQRIAGGMHYMTVTSKGREALNKWQAEQPKPKAKRVGRAFGAWERYKDAFGKIPFLEFWKLFKEDEYFWRSA